MGGKEEKMETVNKTMVARSKGTYILKGSTGAIYIPADLLKDSTFPFKVDQKVKIAIDGDQLTIKKLPKMQHINTFGVHVSIYDNQAKLGSRVGTEIDVHLNETDLICDYCHKTKCEHIDYVLTLPEVHDAYKKKGLTLPNP